jgi:hypothetical protein
MKKHLLPQKIGLSIGSFKMKALEVLMSTGPVVLTYKHGECNPNGKIWLSRLVYGRRQACARLTENPEFRSKTGGMYSLTVSTIHTVLSVDRCFVYNTVL